MGFGNWAVNALVIAATVATALAAVLLHYEGLVWLSRRLARSQGEPRRRVLHGLLVLLGLHVAEIWLFGLVTWGLLRIPDAGGIKGLDPQVLLDTIYLSAASFSTVGFGDLSPVGAIRFLAGTEALVGFMLITWSASFTYLEMEKYWRGR